VQPGSVLTEGKDALRAYVVRKAKRSLTTPLVFLR
jgi:hypothetical protein